VSAAVVTALPARALVVSSVAAELRPQLPQLPQLAVSFSRDGQGRTYVSAQRATHPYHLCRALYRPDDPPGLCTIYTQGSAGGLFEGDRVRAVLAAAPGAQAHVTSAAATIVHRMPGGGRAGHDLTLSVGAGALLELVPDPLILFPGSRLVTRTRIRLEPGARAIVADSFLVHELPDDDGPFALLDCETRIEGAEGKLRARERYVATGADLRAEGSWRCGATVMVLGAGGAPLGLLRAAVAALDSLGGYGGASALPDDTGVLARLLARDGQALRAGVHACWAAGRAALGLPAAAPRPK
jgi:urease accessory protein